MADRLIELALETLESRKAAIDAEIQQLRAQLRSPRRRGVAARTGATAVVKKRRPRSAAARKAQSQRMKEYWARKRAETAAKPSKGK
jgi:hypothetical protein